MDFTINTSVPYTHQKTADEYITNEAVVKKQASHDDTVKVPDITVPKNDYLENQKVRIQEKFASDLKTMQNFLFVMIGSDLKLASEEKPVGMSVNRVA